MNTEVSQDKSAPMTIGQRLSQAREKLGLSQQGVAERLCLKKSTVRDIEEDSISADLGLTFVRGYICSYAKLVHIPQHELVKILVDYSPQKMVNVSPIQSFSLTRYRKKCDGWLMCFTWLMVLLALGLTFAFWWQSHQAQQEEIAAMADQANAKLAQNEGKKRLFSDQKTQKSTSVPLSNNLTRSIDTGTSLQAVAVNPRPPTVLFPIQRKLSDTTLSSSSSKLFLSTGDESRITDARYTNALVMVFSGDCWLQVSDAKGKILFTGVRKSGEQLNIPGTATYKLTIGAPSAVKIQYQGKPVDLRRFVKPSRVARLTITAY
ncbi:Cytoskeleton protein RodZ [Serratia symbiotica]|nr:Cytoskeleton protein RodZ [Serratia symbiotica]